MLREERLPPSVDRLRVARQLEQDPGPIDWIRLDAGGGPEATVSAARRALKYPVEGELQ